MASNLVCGNGSMGLGVVPIKVEAMAYTVSSAPDLHSAVVGSEQLSPTRIEAQETTNSGESSECGEGYGERIWLKTRVNYWKYRDGNTGGGSSLGMRSWRRKLRALIPSGTIRRIKMN